MPRIVRPALVLATLVAACHHDASGPTASQGSYPFSNIPAPAGGVGQFSVVPVTPASGLSLTALGNLNPPGHVLPTDHVYFYATDLSGTPTSAGTVTRNVFMPATGAVTFMLQPSGTDWKVEFRATDNFFFYLDHVLLTRTIKVGDILQAGTMIGTTDPGGTLDLGAFDMTVSHPGFVNAARYGMETLHVVSPWRYFASSMQPQLYAQVYRAATATDKDGKVDFGVAGKLAGDWFLQGMPVDSSMGPYGWPRTVAFVYDYYDPARARISIGGTIAPAGVWATDPTAPRFEDVSVASGVVSYRLLNPFDVRPPYGLMVVQMVSDTQIRVEVFVGSAASSGQLDASAFTFVR
ncbi:MAG: hypothetical protein ACHQQ3_11890 [Gemmatimonadales bacterium]